MTHAGAPGAPDAALLVAASRARTQEILVAGLLHDLNGPLNTLRLTIELLERMLAQGVAGGDDATRARVRRYLDALGQEATRMASWGRTLATAVTTPAGAAAPDALGALLEEAQRLFRHHAALSEVRLEAVPARDDELRVPDAGATRALLATLFSVAIAIAPAGGVVRIEAIARGAHARVRLAVDSARIAPDSALALAPAFAAPRSALEIDLAALRMQAESLHGEASLEIDARGAVVEIALPRA